VSRRLTLAPGVWQRLDRFEEAPARVRHATHMDERLSRAATPS
jgi:hypothetical protein